MPSNLYLNESVTFICGRKFTFAGVDYDVLDEFDQELAPGRVEQLVRTRHIYPVVDDRADKTRFFHREIHVREDIERILGKARGVGQIVLGDAEPEQPPVEPEPESVDVAEELAVEAEVNVLTEEVLEQENEGSEGDEPDVIEEELFDPSEHNAPEVNEYLASEITQEEYNRVIAAERLGKKRKGILGD